MRHAAAALRRGFTLVELLVVLAIIAILAGILFPVFASARRSAQTVACLSNFKNAFAATEMYVQDYDDRMMPSNHRPGVAPDPLLDQTWPQILLPYAGGFGTFDCPAEPNAMDFGGAFDEDLLPGDYATRYFNAALHSDLGYNVYYLAPVLRDGDGWISAPRSMSEVNPRTLLFIESRAAGGGSYLVAPPCRYTVDHNQWRDSFTRQEGGPWMPNDPVFTPIKGWDTAAYQTAFPQGGVGVRHGERLNVARLDGGARSVTLETLSSGCQVRSGWTGSITDPARYPWAPVE